MTTSYSRPDSKNQFDSRLKGSYTNSNHASDHTMMMSGTSGQIRMKCANCKRQVMMQRNPGGVSIYMQPASHKKADGNQYASDDIAQKLNSTRGGGRSLSREVSKEMGSKIGADFSDVKAHTDRQAARMNKELGAQAFTYGCDIYFGRGKYDPGSSTGKHLLAHELTHVVQQKTKGVIAPRIQREMVPDRDGELYYATREGAENRLNNLIRIIPDPEREGNYLIEWRWDTTDPAEDPWNRGTRTYGSRQEAEDRVDELMRVSGEGDRWYVQKDTELRPSSLENEDDDSSSGEEATGSSETETDGEESSSGGKICLTFDDGPKSATPGVLDELAGEGILATFFLTGGNMRRNPQRQEALVMRMLREGHRIANHVFRHYPTTDEEYERAYGSLIDSSVPDNPDERSTFEENYRRNEEHFRDLLGSDFPGFDVARLPGQGRTFAELVAMTERMGMPHVAWDFEFGNDNISWLDARNWQSIAGVRATYSRLPSRNDIILLHDAHWSGSNQAKLGRILWKLKANRFSFGLIDSSGNCT